MTSRDASIADAEIQQAPYEYYRSLRGAPLHYDARAGFFVCVDYDLIREILRNTDVFRSHGSQTIDSLRRPPAEAVALRRTMVPMVDTLVTNDPPAHGRIRAMVDNPFRPKRVAELSAAIRDIVLETAAAFLPRGECEFVHDFAIPVPIQVIADQLGVPRELAPKIKVWSDAAIEPLGMMVSDVRIVECTRLQKEFQDYFTSAFDERERAPRDDLLTHLVTVRDERGQPLSLAERLSITSQLLVAGNETTTNAMAAGMRALAERPDLLATLVERPERARTFAEEVLRLEAPVQGLFRIVAEDTEIGGVRLPRGARVMLRYGAANRDPKKYTNPDELDLARGNAATHLAFGGGIHHCLGATLAREELVQTFALLPPKLANLRPAPGKNDFRHHPNMLLRGLERLHLEFDAVAPDA